MAKSAVKSRHQGFVEILKSFAEDHPEEIRVGLVAAAIVFFFTQGLPLWDDDYSQWLTQANGGFFNLIFRLISPFTSDPATWGYSDRPVQVLIYKILHLIFGYWGTGFFFVKSLVFGGLCGTLYHWMRRWGVEKLPAYLALSVLVLSTNVLASLIWHSDFGVYSQLALTGILFWALPEVEKGPSSLNVYKKGWAGLPKSFSRFIILFFVTVYFGSKLKGDVRLAPVILLAYLWLTNQAKAKVYVAPLALTFLATLPWSKQMFQHLPPFMPGASAYTGWTYGSFSVGRIFEFLVGDLFTIRHAPLSLLGAVGIFVTLALVAYAGYRAYREELMKPSNKTIFVFTWLGVTLLACGILAPQSPNFQLRYTLLPLVPATLFLAIIFQAACKEFAKIEYFKYAALAVIVLQGAISLAHDYQYRREMGRTMVAIDQIYKNIEEKHPTSQMLLYPGFLSYGYKPTVASVDGRKNYANGQELEKYPAGNTYIASWTDDLDPRLSLESVASGCSGAFFDIIAPCPPAGTALILKYNGVMPEVAQADSSYRQGNLPAARQLINTALARDPSNHGLAFVAGFYAYSAGDYAAMEKVYDQIGPFFPFHTSVIYNWGLAKQGMQKFAEASELLEKASAQAPKDYAVGFNLADTLYKQGTPKSKGRAIAKIKEMLEVYPNSQPMKDALEKWSH